MQEVKKYKTLTDIAREQRVTRNAVYKKARKREKKSGGVDGMISLKVGKRIWRLIEEGKEEGLK